MVAPSKQRDGKSAKPNLVDRVIGYFAPRTGLLRTVAREQLARAYEGASRRDGWNPRRAGASANADHLADAAELRTRARFLVQNVPYVARAIDQLVAHTIGTGITPRSLSEPLALRNRIDALWEQWAAVADADGLGDFYGLQARAYRAMEIDGEVLLRLRPRSRADGLPVPLQIQVLEIDWLDSLKNGTAGGNTIVNGIEYTPLGKIAAYWLFDKHPGESVGLTRRSGSYSRPVPAGRIIHLFNPERPGQGRGFSRLAPVIATVRDLSLYEDAELSRKNLETRLAVLASGDISQLAERPEGAGGDPKDLGQLASGGITQVPAGMQITVVEPKPAPGYVDYVKERKHSIAAGIGVTYEMMTGDMSETNFSSARVGQNDVRRSIEQRQWLLLVPMLCQRVRSAWFEAAVMAELLPRGADPVDWSTPRWEYVNPLQEVNADNAEVQGGLCSISEKLRRRGYKPDLVFAEMESDLKRLETSGVLALLLAMKSGNVMAVTPSEDSPPRPSK